MSPKRLRDVNPGYLRACQELERLDWPNTDEAVLNRAMDEVVRQRDIAEARLRMEVVDGSGGLAER